MEDRAGRIHALDASTMDARLRFADVARRWRENGAGIRERRAIRWARFLNTYSGDVGASLDRSGSRRLCPWVAPLDESCHRPPSAASPGGLEPLADRYGSERRSYWRPPKLDYFGRDERRRVLNRRMFWSLQLLFDVLVKMAPKRLGTHRQEDNTCSEIHGLKSVAHHRSSA